MKNDKALQWLRTLPAAPTIVINYIVDSSSRAITSLTGIFSSLLKLQVQDLLPEATHLHGCA